MDYFLNFLPIAGLVSLVMRMVFLGGPEAYDRLFAVAVGEHSMADFRFGPMSLMSIELQLQNS